MFSTLRLRSSVPPTAFQSFCLMNSVEAKHSGPPQPSCCDSQFRWLAEMCRWRGGGRRPLTAAEMVSRGNGLARLFTQYLISTDFKWGLCHAATAGAERATGILCSAKMFTLGNAPSAQRLCRKTLLKSIACCSSAVHLWRREP